MLFPTPHHHHHGQGGFSWNYINITQLILPRLNNFAPWTEYPVNKQFTLHRESMTLAAPTQPGSTSQPCWAGLQGHNDGSRTLQQFTLCRPQQVAGWLSADLDPLPLLRCGFYFLPQLQPPGTHRSALMSRPG